QFGGGLVDGGLLGIALQREEGLAGLHLVAAIDLKRRDAPCLERRDIGVFGLDIAKPGLLAGLVAAGEGGQRGGEQQNAERGHGDLLFRRVAGSLAGIARPRRRMSRCCRISASASKRFESKRAK